MKLTAMMRLLSVAGEAGLRSVAPTFRWGLDRERVLSPRSGREIVWQSPRIIGSSNRIPYLSPAFAGWNITPLSDPHLKVGATDLAPAFAGWNITPLSDPHLKVGATDLAPASPAHQRPSLPHRHSERGFTLASLLVILTVMSVILAFSVPRMWSDVMRREREMQTVWAMKQYARAIAEYQKKRGALPTKLEQLEEQTSPRVLRSLYPNPFSGELDWIPMAPTTATAQVPGQPGSPGVPGLPSPRPGPTPTPPQPGLNPSTGLQGEYSGPIGGVRPPLTGPSMIVLNGQDRYENWVYTITELAQEQTGAGPVQDPSRAAPLK